MWIFNQGVRKWMQRVENNNSKAVIFDFVIPTKIYVELFQNSSRKLVSFQKNIFMIPVRNRFPVFCVMTII